MAGEAESQQPVAVEAKSFHVNLEPNDSAYAEHEDDQPLTAADVSEPAVKAKAEAAPEATEDEGFPGDDVEYDENDPKQKAAYEAFRKAMLPKWQKRVEALKKAAPATVATDTPAAKPPQEEATATAAQTTILDDFYADPLGDEWKPDGVVGFDKDSDLAGYQDELEAFVNARVKKAVQHTLATMRQRGAQLEQVQQERQAAGVIEEYVKSLEDHPEYESLYAQLAEIAPGTKELAIKNPKKWVQMAAGLLGVAPDWHKAATDDDEDDDVPAAPVRRLGGKQIAATVQATSPRTARAPQRTAVARDGRLGFDDAFDAALRQHRVR